MQDSGPARDRLDKHVDAQAVKLAQTTARLRHAKQERRQSEILFRKLLESAPDGIVITARDGTIALANSQAEKMFGYSADELAGMPVEILVPEDLRAVHRQHRRHYAGNPHVRPMSDRQHLQARRKDGTTFPAEISLSPVDSEAGPLVFSSIRDISELLQREQQIQANLNIQSVIASILKLSLQPIPLESFLEHTLELLQALSWLNLENKAAIFLVEDDPEVLVMKAQVGMPAAMLDDCAQLQFGKCLCGQAAQSREIVFANCLDHPDAAIFGTSAPHGHYCVPILSGDHLLGVINLYVKDGHDGHEVETTFLHAVADTLAGTIERKRAEKDLAASRERFDLAVTGTDSGIWDWDIRTDSVYYSPRWKSMIGYEDHQIGNTRSEWEDRIHQDDRDHTLATMKRYLEGESSELELEYRLRLRNGRFRWFLGRGALVRSPDGRPTRMVGSHIDITSRKLAEKSLREKEAQLRAAQRIQEKILPERAPQLPGFDIAGAYRPADFAAGDHFDYFTAPDGSLLLVIGDVSGHGFSTALLMASTHAYLRMLAGMGLDIGEIFCRANSILAQETESNQYITAILARIDAQARRLHFISAGHPAGYVLDSGGQIKEVLGSTAMPLAVLPEAEFASNTTFPLASGDTVVFLTDGILEARSPTGEFFEPEGVLAVVRSCLDQTAADTAAAICNAARRFNGNRDQEDDFTALVIKVD